MKRLLIHIGTMKTGTSSIQECLISSIPAFKEQNIFYFAEMHHNNHSFSPLFKSRPEASYDWKKNYGTTDVKSKVQQLKRHWTDLWEEIEEGTAVVSSETMSFYGLPDIKRLHTFVSPLFDEIRIIIYFRDPGRYIPSMLQQDIKNGYTPSDKSFLEYYQGREIEIKYKEQLSRWIKIFGQENVVVRPFQPKSFRNGSLEMDFFYHGCGVDIRPETLTVSRRNESLSLESAIFLYELNKKYPTIKNGKLNEERGMGNRPLPFGVFQHYEGTRISIPLYYDSERRKAIAEQVEYVNRFLPEQDWISCTIPEQKTSATGACSESLEEDPSIDYFVEVINAYNQLVERKNQRIHALQNRVDNSGSGRKSVRRLKVNLSQEKISKSPRMLFRLIQFALFKDRVIFNQDYYQAMYDDVDYTNISALKHYFLYGAYEKRLPRAGGGIGKSTFINPLVREYLKRGLSIHAAKDTTNLRLQWTDHRLGDFKLDDDAVAMEMIQNACQGGRNRVKIILPDFTTYVFWHQDGKGLDQDSAMSKKQEYLQMLRRVKTLSCEFPDTRIAVERNISVPDTEKGPNYPIRISSILHYCLSCWDENPAESLKYDDSVPSDLHGVLYPDRLMEHIHLEALLSPDELQELDDGVGESKQILDESLFVEWMNCYHKAIEMAEQNKGN